MTSNAELVREHLTALRRTNARADTIKHRRDNIFRLAMALSGPLIDVGSEELQRWQDDLLGRVTPSTISTYTSHVRSFYNWAHAHHWVADNPARDLQSPRLRVAKARPISEDHLRVAIACAVGDVRVWLILAAYCGLRAGEIARLTRDDVGDETLDVDGKGGHPRTVPLPASVRTILVPHLGGPGPIWRNADGRQVTPRHVSKRAGSHLRACGTGAVLHMLRHRYATRMYQLSKDPKMVQEVLGHLSLDTTTRYLAVAAERGRETAEQLSRGLCSATGGRRAARRRERKPAA